MKCWGLVVSTLLLFAGSHAAAAEADPAGGGPKPIAYGKPRLLCQLANQKIRESSGVACSRRQDGVFWTHNDSGDGPRLYAFNTKGENLGTFEVVGAKARDWEDIASFRTSRTSYLLLADTGDNGRQRQDCTVYLVKEPHLPPGRRRVTGRVGVARTIRFRYEDGPRDCEAVAIDPKDKLVYLVSKVVGAGDKVYVLPVPRGRGQKTLVARAIATLKLPIATAMDLSPDGTRAVVLTYGHAFEFSRKAGETWATAFGRPPRRLTMPGRQQGEALCYGRDGRTLYLTSEGWPSPLWEVPVSEADRPNGPDKDKR